MTLAKFFWVDARPFKKDLVTAALEGGANAVWVDKGFEKDVRALGLISVISPAGDLKPGKEVIEYKIESQRDEDAVVNAPGDSWAVIRCDDWKIIPLENLIAKRPGRLVAAVNNVENAMLALEIMERGVDGVLLENATAVDVKNIASKISGQSEKLNLVAAKIVSVKSLGMGDRVCVDTTSILKKGQGLLVGDSSSGMLLVHAENVETPYCDPRPFRVNAGAVHAYVRIPGNKTKYLSDLCASMPVLVIDQNGRGEVAFVGRSKIERRPLLMIEAEHGGKRATLVLQNAETIRLTKPDGSPTSVVSLKPGDEVLAFFEDAGRHFGSKVTETIREK